MNADQLAKKLEGSGCTMTSAGVMAIDTRKLIVSFIGALEEIERLEVAVAVERERCAGICDEADRKDESDNGAAMTGAAAAAASAIRGQTP